jgi:SAM-dependent methyltransferase
MRTGIIGGVLADRLLARMTDPETKGYCDGSAYHGQSKLEVMLGTDVWGALAGKRVIEFGCGSGRDAIEMVRRGARSVIGVDIRETALEQARKTAEDAGVADRCHFTHRVDEPAELVISLDGFEHFADPEGVLEAMSRLLTREGRALIAFGPTWLHPLGGHFFSFFPWAHLIFSEPALLRWRARFKHDGATRFADVEGGLNQMTIARFERLVAHSPLAFEAFETVPIRKLRRLANPITREFLTSFVRCRLRARSAS